MDAKLGFILNLIVLISYLLVLKQYEHIFSAARSSDHQELAKFLEKYRYCFLTGWNFANQILFLTLSILDVILQQLEDGKITKFLNKARSMLFQAVVFPTSLLVISTFWTMFIYDRELIFPKNLDAFYPTWMNHALHTAIILPLIIEVSQPKRYNYIKFFPALVGHTIFLITYQVVYYSVYFKDKVFLYPMHARMNLVENILFMLVQYAFCITYVAMGIFVQNRRSKIRSHFD